VARQQTVPPRPTLPAGEDTQQGADREAEQGRGPINASVHGSDCASTVETGTGKSRTRLPRSPRAKLLQ